MGLQELPTASYSEAGLQLPCFFLSRLFPSVMLKVREIEEALLLPARDLYTYSRLTIKGKKEKGLLLNCERCGPPASSSQLLQGLLLQPQRTSSPKGITFPGQPMMPDRSDKQFSS